MQQGLLVTIVNVLESVSHGRLVHSGDVAGLEENDHSSAHQTVYII
jgi:hypothetical protein